MGKTLQVRAVKKPPIKEGRQHLAHAGCFRPLKRGAKCLVRTMQHYSTSGDRVSGLKLFQESGRFVFV